MISGFGLRGGLFATLLSALTAGCVSGPVNTPDVTAPAPAASTTPAAVDTASVHTAALSRIQDQPTQDQPTRRITFSPAERDPDRLRRLGPDAVTALIGSPGYVRHEGGAIIWQYIASGCVMDLFWYRSDHGLTLLHYETRSLRLARQAESGACFTNLLIRQTAALDG